VNSLLSEGGASGRSRADSHLQTFHTLGISSAKARFIVRALMASQFSFASGMFFLSSRPFIRAWAF
jgi:hypothetical protein